MKIFKIKEFLKLEKNEIRSIFNDHVVVLPTETVYGLASKIDCEATIKKIFDVKGRPSDNPLIVHISSLEMLDELIVGKISKEYHLLIKNFWPGPLSLVFESKNTISKTIRGQSLNTLVVRMPKCPMLREIINIVGVPLAMPSANSSGKPSPTSVHHVIDDLKDSVPFYIDGGECESGLESTIFGIVDSKNIIFRPGAVTKEQLEKILDRQVEIKPNSQSFGKFVCPGMKYKHYSPAHPLYMFQNDNWKENMIKLRKEHEDWKIGILMHSSQRYDEICFDYSYNLGNNLKECAKNVYAGLRYLDKTCDAIFISEFPIQDEGLAIMDRLLKASSYIIR